MAHHDTTIDVKRLLAEREWLQNLAARLLGDTQDADDLAQETLRVALETGGRPLGRSAGVSSVRAWLGTVARRLAGEDWRSRANRRAREVEVAQDEALPPPEDALERVALRRFLANAVLALDEPLRTAVVLRYFEGQSYADVARHTDVTQVAARKRVSRAIALLRERLDVRSNGDRTSWMVALAPLVATVRQIPEATPASAGRAGWLLATASLVLGLTAVLAWIAFHETTAPIGSVDREVGTVVDDRGDGLSERGPQTGGRARVAPSIPDPPESPPEPRIAFPARMPAEVGTVHLSLVWHDDGSPVADRPLTFRTWEVPESSLHARELRTDRNGRVVIDQIPPGHGLVYDACGEGFGFDVAPGETRSVTFRLPRGYAVEGVVVDGVGDSVVGASLRIASTGSTDLGRICGMSAGGGRFRIEGVSGLTMLEATLVGREPSARILLEGAEEGTVSVELVIGGEAFVVHGTVVDELEVPVRGARVRLTPKELDGRLRILNGRYVGGTRTAREVRTDVYGAFRFDDVPAGAQVITARTAMHAPATLDVDPVLLQDDVATLRLKPGALLEGRVEWLNGSPVAHADVRIGSLFGFDGHIVITDEDGRYRFETLPAGDLSVEVGVKGHVVLVDVVQTIAGETRRWDVTITDDTLDVEGVVVTEAGEPLVRWRVGAMRAGGIVEQAITDDSGRFRMTDIRREATALVVGPLDAHDVGWALRLPGVIPADGPLRIEVPDQTVPTASIVGRVVGPDGRRLAEAQIRLSAPSALGSRKAALAEDGAFRFDSVFAGEATLTCTSPGLVWNRQVLDLEPGEALDVGEIQLNGGGCVDLEVHATWLESGDADFTVYERVDERTRQFVGRVGPGVTRLGPFATGRVSLWVEGKTIAATQLDVDVVGDRTSKAHVTLEPGLAGRALLLYPGCDADDGEVVSFGCTWRLLDGAGRVILGQRRRFSIPHPAQIDLFGLASGTYVLDVEDVEGRRGAGTFQVDLEGARADGPFVTIEMR